MTSCYAKIPKHGQIRSCAYKTFFMLNIAEHEISKLDKSNLINLLEKLLTCGDFHCFCLSNQSFKSNRPYSLKDKLGFQVGAQTQLSMDSSFISTGLVCLGHLFSTFIR